MAADPPPNKVFNSHITQVTFGSKSNFKTHGGTSMPSEMRTDAMHSSEKIKEDKMLVFAGQAEGLTKFKFEFSDVIIIGVGS